MSNFCVFFENRFLTVKFSKYVPKVFTASPIDVVVLKFRQIFPT